MYAFNENFLSSSRLSHDEVVHLKGSMLTKMMAGELVAEIRFAAAECSASSTPWPGKKLNFMGQEFGEWKEWGERKTA